MGSFFITQIHPAMLYTASSLRFYTSPFLMQTIRLFRCCLWLIYCLVVYTSMPLRVHACMPLRLYASLCLYASTPLCLYSSTALRLYALKPLRLYTSMPVRLWYFTLPSLIGEAITDTRERRNRA